MAIFSVVNKAIKSKFPELKITCVRGAGYVYFTNDDGMSEPKSIMVHPVNTSTEQLTEWAIQEIEEWLPKHKEEQVIALAARAAHNAATTPSAKATDEAVSTPRNDPATSEQPTYTPEQHAAIAAIMADYRTKNARSGRPNAEYHYQGKTHDNEVFISVKHLDALCGLEPKVPAIVDVIS